MPTLPSEITWKQQNQYKHHGVAIEEMNGAASGSMGTKESEATRMLEASEEHIYVICETSWLL